MEAISELDKGKTEKSKNVSANTKNGRLIKTGSGSRNENTDDVRGVAFSKGSNLPYFEEKKKRRKSRETT